MQILSSVTRGVAAPVSKWVRRIARVGYAARGVVYLLVGGLALLSALGRGGGTGSQTDALRSVLETPGGWVWLGLLAVGLLAFAAWRGVQAAADPDHCGSDAKGLGTRFGHLVSAVTHVLLALAAARLAWGTGRGGGGAGEDAGTAWLMAKPFGRGAVGIIGAVVMAVGVGFGVRAWKEKFEKHLSMPGELLKKLRPVMKFGLYARGVVLLVTGGFLVYAAWMYDPQQAGGLSDVFDTVRGQPFGRALLAALAAGLFSFGIYGLIQARYRELGDVPG